MKEQSVVIEGGESREHALAYSMIASGVNAYVDPPNAGTHGNRYLEERPGNPDLVIVGPEDPIIAGRSDQLEAMGHTVLAVNEETAFLEGLKIKAGKAMRDFGILHPPYVPVFGDYDQALAAINGRYSDSYVLKANKPYRGQAVVLPRSRRESIKTIRGMISGELFEGAGHEFQVQDRWHGPEVSVFSVADAQGNYYVFPFAIQDHKRLLDEDKGPNTGGTGAYGPVPDTILQNWQWEGIMDTVDKTYAGLKRKKLSTKGFLFFGFMLADEVGGAAALIEWNVRLGSPEAQVLLPLLVRCGVDVFDLFYSAAQGNLDPELFNIPMHKILGSAALAVNMMPAGYPDDPVEDAEIKGLNESYDNALFFHGKTRQEGSKIIAPTNRGLTVVGLGGDIAQAQASAYGAIRPKEQPGPGVYYEKDNKRADHYRTDIGWQALPEQA